MSTKKTLGQRSSREIVRESIANASVKPVPVMIQKSTVMENARAAAGIRPKRR